MRVGTLPVEQRQVHAARHTPLRTRQPLGRACIRALGSLLLLVAGLAAASPPSDTLDRPQLDAFALPGHTAETAANVDRNAATGVMVARAETTQRRRIEPGFEEGAEADLEPSAEPGLHFEGAFEFKIDWLNNIALGQRPQDDVQFSEEEVQLGLSYRRERLLFFGEIKLVGDQAVFADQTPNMSEEAIERGEMWLLLKQVFHSNYSVQIGRQNFIEPRLWWWDEDLDAARFYYTREPWRLYVGIAEELGRVATNEDFIDPEEEDVKRLLAYANWTSSEKLALDGFFLTQRDDSNTPATDSVIENVQIDAADANLTWAGLRATGVFDLSRRGRLQYRADTAIVTGDETLVVLEDDVPGFSSVIGTQKRNVRGWAVDLGTTWTLPLRGDPTLKLIYAYASGDDNLNDDTDRSFRQTGLQDKDEEFRDYGVVLRPELSNLQIATLAFGLPVYTGTRLTLGYHYFRQVDGAPFLRATGIDVEPTGESKDIGQEVSLVVQLRKWEDLQMDVIAGSFKAGRAYGAAANERSNRLFFKLIYEF